MLIRIKWRFWTSWRHLGCILWHSQLLCLTQLLFIDYFGRGDIVFWEAFSRFMLIRIKWHFWTLWHHFGCTLWHSQLLCLTQLLFIDYFGGGHIVFWEAFSRFMLIRTKWHFWTSWRHFGCTLWRSQLLCLT